MTPQVLHPLFRLFNESISLIAVASSTMFDVQRLTLFAFILLMVLQVGAYPAMMDALDGPTREMLLSRSPSHSEPTSESSAFLYERQTQILPPVAFPPVIVPGLPLPITITVPGVITVGRKIIPDVDHRFQAPGPTDQRGGCPGLNIMANYGYVDRSGIITTGELLYGLQEMLGLSFELATILTALGFRGMTDLTTLKMSIGTTDTRTNGLLSFLFGQAPGLFSFPSHTKYEVDGSMAYTDEIFTHDHAGNHFNSSLWATNTAFAQANGGIYDLEFNSAVRYNAYQQCVATNPECSWLAAGQILFYGAECFTFLLFPSNGVDGNPEPATATVVNTFMGTHPNGDGTFTKVPERIPAGSTGPWYRRSLPLQFAQVVNAAIASYLAHPVAFGVNANGINSFLVSGPQLDETNLTVQAVSCLIIDLIIEETPTAAGAIVNTLLSSVMTDLNC